ncbi:hypothetical protein ACHAXT_004183 [Thalassiosira profunda]
MNASSHQRSKRWNRRSSDGAAWGSDTELERDDDDGGQDRRRSSCSMPFRRGGQPWSNREPFRMTKEFRDRIAAAVRASSASASALGLLVFASPVPLPAAWIGNVLALSTLKTTLGDTYCSARDIFIPLIPVALASWGTSALLDSLTTTVYSVLLPVATVVWCGVVFLCPWPWLKSKNLMLTISYLTIASPLSLRESGYDNNGLAREHYGRWFSPGLLATCTIGLCVGLAIHAFTLPTKKSTTASRSAPTLMNRLAGETQQLLFAVTEYLQNIGQSSSDARQARTLIEYYVKRMEKTLCELEALLPAMKVEKKLCSTKNLEAAERFVECSKKQLKHAELLRLATTQQFLGEEFTSLNATVRGVKTTMSTNLGFAVEQLALEYSKSQKALLFCSPDANDVERDIVDSLDACLSRYREAMKQAISDAERLLQNNDAASRSTTGPLIRQRVAFLAVFSFVYELRETFASNGKETQDDEASKTAMQRVKSGLTMPWLWSDIEKRRAALKTAMGMGIASLWVSFPYLRGYVAYPQSVWVGLTVASVSLDTTGATYTKSLDRLYATLIAAGYALFVGKVFDPSNNIAKLAAVVVATFGATLVTNYDRPYASRYAATSVGSILFGSIEKGIAVHDYVPLRIMLIFIGTITFLCIELLVFPRSSRTMVQAQSLQFYEDLEHFLFDSSKVCASIPTFHKGTTTSNEEDYGSLVELNPLWMLREGKENVSITDDLSEDLETVKKTVALTKSELKPAMAEPSLGLNVAIDAAGYEGLLSEQVGITQQLDLLITTLKSLIGYHTQMEKEHPVRSLHWPALLSASLTSMAQQLSDCANKLRQVFPNGLCRPGHRDASEVIRAVASFRQFEDVILSTLSDVEERHATFLNSICVDGNVRYTPGFRLTLALAVSAILTIGRSLYNCGKHLETIIQSFPVEGIELPTEELHLRRATIELGASVNDSNGSISRES